MLYAEFVAKPGSEDKVVQLLRGFADEVRSEPGNVLFNAHRKQADPRAFFVYEVYRDDEAFDSHLKGEHGLVFNRALSDLVENGGSQLTLLTSL